MKLIVIFNSENYFPTTQQSSLSFAVSTEICGNYKNLLPISELEPPIFLKTMIAQNKNSSTYLLEIFEKSYKEFLSQNTTAFFILREFSRLFDFLNLVCENKFIEFDFCQFMVSILSASFEVQMGGSR